MADYSSISSALGGLTPFQQASSYLSLYDPSRQSTDALGANTVDPLRDQLIQQGWLGWGSDAQGNQQLTGGGLLQDALNKAVLNSGIKPGSDQGLVETVNPFNLPSRLPNATGDAAKLQATWGGPIAKVISQYMSRLGSDFSSFKPNVSNVQFGDIDPLTGFQKEQLTGFKPEVTRSGNFLDQNSTANLFASLALAPLAAPLAASTGLGGLGSQLFKFLGNEMLNSGGGGAGKQGGVNIMQLLAMLFGRGR